MRKIFNTLIQLSIVVAVIGMTAYPNLAQNPPITKSDVSRYLKTFRTILDERNALDIELQNLKEPTAKQIADLKRKIIDVPKSHGWGIHYDSKKNGISEIFNALSMLKEAEATQDDSRDQRVEIAQKRVDQLTAKYGQKTVSAVDKKFLEIDQIIKGLI